MRVVMFDIGGVVLTNGWDRVERATLAREFGLDPADFEARHWEYADDLEALRIEAGLARFGADMDAERLPMEAGLTRQAIHFGKGCYIGQEVVLRATVRGHLQKGLVQLALPPGAGPGARLLAAGQEVGWVTSAAETTQGRLGLGYLRRAHWKEGERLATEGGEAVVRRMVVEEGTC